MCPTRQFFNRNFSISMCLMSFAIMFLSFCTSGESKSPSEEVNSEFIIDTVTIFDPVTYKESTVIYRSTPELLADKGVPISTQIANDAIDYVLDTVTVLDQKTGEVIMTRITVLPKDK